MDDSIMNAEKKKLNPEEIRINLSQFIGTTQYHRYSPLFRNFLLTDGTKCLCETLECYWLIDIIASYQTHPKVKKHPKLQEIQFWTLEVDLEKQKGVVRCDWDSGQQVIEQAIPYTDFALESQRIWVQPHIEIDNAGGLIEYRRRYWIAHLPSEY